MDKTGANPVPTNWKSIEVGSLNTKDINKNLKKLTLGDIVEYKSHTSWMGKMCSKLNLALAGKGKISSRSIDDMIKNLEKEAIENLHTKIVPTISGTNDIKNGKIQKGLDLIKELIKERHNAFNKSDSETKTHIVELLKTDPGEVPKEKLIDANNIVFNKIDKGAELDEADFVILDLETNEKLINEITNPNTRLGGRVIEFLKYCHEEIEHFNDIKEFAVLTPKEIEHFNHITVEELAVLTPEEIEHFNYFTAGKFVTLEEKNESIENNNTARQLVNFEGLNEFANKDEDNYELNKNSINRIIPDIPLFVGVLETYIKNEENEDLTAGNTIEDLEAQDIEDAKPPRNDEIRSLANKLIITLSRLSDKEWEGNTLEDNLEILELHIPIELADKDELKNGKEKEPINPNELQALIIHGNENSIPIFQSVIKQLEIALQNPEKKAAAKSFLNHGRFKLEDSILNLKKESATKSNESVIDEKKGLETTKKETITQSTIEIGRQQKITAIAERVKDKIKQMGDKFELKSMEENFENLNFIIYDDKCGASDLRSFCALEGETTHDSDIEAFVNHLNASFKDKSDAARMDAATAIMIALGGDLFEDIKKI